MKSIPPANSWADEHNTPILICLLGNFRVLKKGQRVRLGTCTKPGCLLHHLALWHGQCVARDTLLDLLWPNTDPVLASQSLYDAVFRVNRLLGDALNGDTPIVNLDGHYRLNLEAGISIDVVSFEALADAGDQQTRMGNPAAAAESYKQAIDLYRGDLCAGDDVYSVIRRQNLHSRHLTLLARLADYCFGEREYDTSIRYAHRLLERDPGYEAAHRVLMQCHVRRGERSQAIQQYRICEQILREDLGIEPDPETKALFERIRDDPESI